MQITDIQFEALKRHIDEQIVKAVAPALARIERLVVDTLVENHALAQHCARLHGENVELKKASVRSIK